jgi:hypothetical protein
MQQTRARLRALRGSESSNERNGRATLRVWLQKLYKLAALTSSRSRRFLGNFGSGSTIRLLANAELADYVAIAIRIVRLQVVQQAAALADQHEQATPRGMILLMRLEVLGQFGDAGAQNRNLNFRRSGIGIVGAEALNQFGFCCRCQHSVLVTPQIVKSISMSSVRLPRIGLLQGKRWLAQAASSLSDTGSAENGFHWSPRAQ